MYNLPALPTLGLTLIAAPHTLRREMTTRLTIYLALLGELRVLDGGNRFDALKLARELRRQTRTYHAALERIQVARAFTCYQMAVLCSQTVSCQDPTGGTQLLKMPTLVLDLLTTFYDENIALPERTRLLDQSLEQLKRLGRGAPVFVSAEPDDDPFFVALVRRADQHWWFENPQLVARQPDLF